MRDHVRGLRNTAHRAPRTAHLLFRTSTSVVCFLLSALSGFGQQLDRSEISTPYSARSLNLRFSHLNLEDGLSQSVVHDVLQDHNGYMWFGTQEGLNRYDGFEFKVFNHIPFDSTSLKDTQLLSLMEDRDGYLWIGGQAVVSRMDPQKGTFERFEYPRTGGSGAGVLTLIQDRGGNIWAGTSHDGLAKVDPNGAPHFTFFRHDTTDTSSTPPGSISSVFEDSRGSLWVKSPGYLSRMDPERTGRFTHFEINDVRMPGMWWATAIYERTAEEGVLWVGTYDGLLRFDTETGESEHFRLDGGAATEQRVGSIAEDPTVRGVLWVGLGDGIARFDIQTKNFVRYRNDPANPSSLVAGIVTTLEVDRQGLLWIGTYGGGVDRFNPGAVGFELVGSRSGGNGVFENRSIRPVHLTRDNILLVGNGPASGGLDRSLLTVLDRKTGRAKTYQFDSTNPSTVGRVAAVFEDAAGSVWIGGNGIARFDRETGRFEHFLHVPNDVENTAPQFVTRFIQDRRGFLWMSGTGVSRMDPAKPGIFEHFRHNSDDEETLPAGFKIDIAEDASGYLWVATVPGGGVARLDPTTGKVVRYGHNPDDPTTIASDRVWDVLVPEHEPGVIWASGSGLSRLDVEEGTFRNYGVADGLPSQNVYGALEDERGRIWMSTNSGLSRFDPETETFRNYGMESGLQSLEFNGESLHKAHTGEMFFGGINGLNAFFPNSLIESSNPPEPRIVDMRIGDVPIQDVEGLHLDSAVPDLQELTLDYDLRDLTLNFNAFHFQSPSKNQFEYKLEGFNDDWIHAGTRRSASFTNLDPGDYTFRMRAANSDGVWSEEEATLNLTILPPWWRTWWAYLIYAGFFGLVVFSIDRFQRGRLLKKERERTRQKELEQAREIKVAYDKLDKSHENLKQAQDRLIQSEKMASLGQLTAGIAHEIKNPLNFVNNFSDLSKELADELSEQIDARRAEIPDDLIEEIEDILGGLKMNVQKISEHGRRADSIVHGMLQHSRTGEAERAEVDINALVDEHLNLAYHGMRARTPDFNATLETDYDDSVGRLEVVPQDLGRVMLNLIGNAFDALRMSDVGGRTSKVGPTVTVSTARNDGQVEIRISDNGPGIPDQVRDKIFEPFFTTKPTGSGTGLGLSMSYDIVTKGHGGTLEVESVEGEGATFIVRLPAGR